MVAQKMKRGRNQRRRSGTNVNRAFDSNGPEVKIRGTAVQIYDKYQTLARDAASSGDRIRAESLLQHAEHYYRVMKAMQPPQQASPEHQEDGQQNADAGEANANGTVPAKDDVNEAADKSEASSTPEVDSRDEASAADGAEAEAEKPRKPRRKRTPRKSLATADADNSESETSGKSDVPEMAAE